MLSRACPWLARVQIAPSRVASRTGCCGAMWTSQQLADLTTALNVGGIKTEAAELLRRLLSGVRRTAEGTGFALEFMGELAGIMASGESRNDKTRAHGAGSGQLS